MIRLMFLLFLLLISFKSYSQIKEFDELLKTHQYNIIDTEDYLIGKDYSFKGTRKRDYGTEYSFYYGLYPISDNSIIKALNDKNEVIFTEFNFFKENEYIDFKKQLSDHSFEYLTTYNFENGIKHLYSKDDVTIDIYIRKNALNKVAYTFRFVSDKFRLKVYGNDVLINNKRMTVNDFN